MHCNSEKNSLTLSDVQKREFLFFSLPTYLLARPNVLITQRLKSCTLRFHFTQISERRTIYLRSTAGTTMSKTLILKLPPEIFDYLDIRTIFSSLRPACQRLDEVIQSYNHGFFIFRSI